ncbi:platelet-derived growth factor receptor-like protein [Erinaceus europaeus]|uniref:Platelet-derived growth factor receptor-like protein n=1 Tax=Erinaceus europaeus TaxID=9365 RepID=A0ABM3XW85_ERIEU|nr:platelet-derived growth factor receptor-like protein [Erinaceus europaeus]
MAASLGETKSPGAPHDRKPKATPSSQSLQRRTPVSVAAPCPPAPCILTQVLGRGHFQKVRDSLSLCAGVPLELRCRGKEVCWRVPLNLEEGSEGHLRIRHLDQYSQLQLGNSTWADTGEYSCWAQVGEGHVCANGKDLQASIFIFFTDPQELFVPTDNYYKVVQLCSHQPALLPCQVTSPLAQVTLHREFPPEEIPVDGTDISFNVKKGFTIHRPHASMAGSLFSLASLGSVQQISTKYMLLYINYPFSMPTPRIRASAAWVTLGEDFTVTCMALGEPEIAVDFSWDYPGQKLGRPLYTSEWSRVQRQRGQAQQEVGSTLYVEDARAGDASTYTCRATNLQGTGTATIHVQVTRTHHVPTTHS